MVFRDTHCVRDTAEGIVAHTIGHALQGAFGGGFDPPLHIFLMLGVRNIGGEEQIHRVSFPHAEGLSVCHVSAVNSKGSWRGHKERRHFLLVPVNRFRLVKSIPRFLGCRRFRRFRRYCCFRRLRRFRRLHRFRRFAALLRLAAVRFRDCRSAAVWFLRVLNLQAHRRGVQFFQKRIVQRSVLGQPDHHRLLRAAAVEGVPGNHRVVCSIDFCNRVAVIRRDGWDLDTCISHRLQLIDAGQFLLGFLDLQFGLLHVQPLALQLQLRQGGVVGHEHVALFHLVPLLYQHLGDGLGVGQEHGLDPIGGDRAVALLIVAPEFRHTHHGEGIHPHRLSPAPKAKEQPGGNRCGSSARADGNDSFFRLARQFPIKLFHRVPPESAARRPECGRFCPRRRRWKVHG